MDDKILLVKQITTYGTNSVWEVREPDLEQHYISLVEQFKNSKWIATFGDFKSVDELLNCTLVVVGRGIVDK